VLEEVDDWWWWPLATLGGSIGIFFVVGVIGHQEMVSRNPEAKEQARRFSMLLERRGFRTGVRDLDASSLVDFYDPELRRILTEVGAPYDREKVSDYALFLTGTVEFWEHPGTRAVTLFGDIPVAIIRRPMARGFVGHRVEVPPDVKVTEVHWHTQDGLPRTHLHVEGELPVDLDGLARFIGSCRDISKSFIIAGG
jgi:hypothetical protein